MIEQPTDNIFLNTHKELTDCTYHSSPFLKEVRKDILTAYPEDAVFFLNEGKLREKVALLKEFFLPEYENRVIAYAVKANAKKEILHILSDEGIQHFDCASRNEIKAVLETNKNATIFYNHPIKKNRDIQFSLEQGVQHFTVQSKKEIEKIRNNLSNTIHTTPLEIAVRLKSENKKAQINLSHKFGANPTETKEILQYIQQQKDILPGIYIHIGSQNIHSLEHAKEIKYATNIVRETGKVKTLNIGGGIGVNYDQINNFDTIDYLHVISQTIRENISDILLKDPKVIIELGRAIVAESMDLCIPILSIENRNGKKCIYIDDGVFTSFSDAYIHNWKYPFQVIDKEGEKIERKTEEYVMFGRTCDSGDALGTVNLPENITEEDYIYVPYAGAYMDSQSSKFNGFDPPKYVIYNSKKHTS